MPDVSQAEAESHLTGIELPTDMRSFDRNTWEGGPLVDTGGPLAEIGDALADYESPLIEKGSPQADIHM